MYVRTEALETRVVIGQAMGILMAQEDLSSDGAFEKLKLVSQNNNIKLREVAQRLVDAGPEEPSAAT